MKIPNFLVFELFQHAISQKESILLIELNFTQKKYDLFEKKCEKINFFNFSSNKWYFFSVKLISTWKMLSFEVLHVEITQKMQNLEFSLIFSNFLKDLQFSPFFCNFWKKNSEKGAKWVRIDASFWGKMIFEQKFVPAPR